MRGAERDLIRGKRIVVLGGMGLAGGQFDGVGDFADCGGQFLHGGGLLRRALRHSLRAGGNLFAAVVDLIGGHVDLCHRIADGDGQRGHSGLEAGETAQIHGLFAAADIEVAFAHGGKLHLHVGDNLFDGGGQVAHIVRQSAQRVLRLVFDDRFKVALGHGQRDFLHLIDRCCNAVGHGNRQSKGKNDADNNQDNLNGGSHCGKTVGVVYHRIAALIHACGDIVNHGLNLIGDGRIGIAQIGIAPVQIIVPGVHIELFQQGIQLVDQGFYTVQIGRIATIGVAQRGQSVFHALIFRACVGDIALTPSRVLLHGSL